MQCLVAADLDAPMDGLRRVMDRLGVDLVEPDQLGVDWLAEEPAPTIDFVCGVLRAAEIGDAEAAVYVDIGVALGRRIPVFLVVSPGRKVPLAVASLTRVEAGLDNEEALELHLRQFIRAISREPVVSHKHNQQGLTPSQLNSVRARLRDATLHKRDGNPSSARLASLRYEQLIGDLLTESNAIVSTRHHDVGYDLALWVDDAGRAIGGPVLVQLKLWRRVSSSGFQETVDRFAKLIVSRGAPFGLIIYHAAEGERQPLSLASSAVPVVTISAVELVETLARMPLGQLLIHMRNAVMHGVPYRA